MRFDMMIGHTAYHGHFSACWVCILYSLSFHRSCCFLPILFCSGFETFRGELHVWDLVHLLHTSQN